MFVLSYRWVTQIKFLSVNHPYSGKDLQFRFFYVVKGGYRVSLEATGSPVPSAQKNLHASVAYSGGEGTVLNPFMTCGIKSNAMLNIFIHFSTSVQDLLELVQCIVWEF